MKRLSCICIFLISFACIADGQNMHYARKVVKTLAGKAYYGRGYVNNGDGKAAAYIRGQYVKHGLITLADNYYQSFSFPINSFPGSMSLRLNDRLLKPGIDFQVNADMKRAKGLFPAVFISHEVLNNAAQFAEYKHQFSLQSGGPGSGSWLIIDTFDAKRDPAAKAHYKYLTDTCKCVDGIVILKNTKFTWTVATEQADLRIIEMQRNSYKSSGNMSDILEIDIDALFQERHKTQNVLGYIRGTETPDSFIAITAHYDHLGMMGDKTIFPGANDNASGIAMLLNLAKYYHDHPPRYSMLFIAFAGEEAGLIGSRLYTDNPVLPLSQISFLINLDLIGSGEDGVMTVNGAVFKTQYDLLTEINNKYHYLSAVKARGKAANSDHYWFSEKGVRCFFFYLMGPYSHYHDVYDTARALPLTKFKAAFRLFRDFTDALQNKNP